MKRPVVVADVVGVIALVRPGGGCSLAEVEQLVKRAGIVDYRVTATSVVLASRRVADLEAYAQQSRGRWVVVRASRKRRGAA